jgi:oxygen-independent coproporphyrinogen-3 oxidase
MPALPDADPAPADGRLPEGLDWDKPLRAYVHVPFCASRCGYCDFNTYTAGEVGGFDFDGYARAVGAEIDLAARVSRVSPLASVFLGGGTPSLLPPATLGGILDHLRGTLGIAVGAEVTIEANPENVDAAALQGWLDAGVTRISLGMQSADPAALRVLDRVHTPGRAGSAAVMARDAGFEHVSLDLIYGVPGQSVRTWRTTVEAALDAGPDHISTYALGVESGTALARRVARGEVPAPDPDAAAEQYEVTDALMHSRGMTWYEISNWALPGGQCAHNVGYWSGDNWWGFGPGAHSHVGGVRWWNVKRPAQYARALARGQSPAAAREVLDAGARRTEAVMLGVRMAGGIDPAGFPPRRIAHLRADGLLEDADGARLRLTLKGRLLADAVVRVLLWGQGATG